MAVKGGKRKSRPFQLGGFFRVSGLFLLGYADFFAVQLVVGPDDNQDQTKNKADDSETHCEEARKSVIGTTAVNLYFSL